MLNESFLLLRASIYFKRNTSPNKPCKISSKFNHTNRKLIYSYFRSLKNITIKGFLSTTVLFKYFIDAKVCLCIFLKSCLMLWVCPVTIAVPVLLFFFFPSPASPSAPCAARLRPVAVFRDISHSLEKEGSLLPSRPDRRSQWGKCLLQKLTKMNGG